MDIDNDQYFGFSLKPQQSRAFIAMQKFARDIDSKIFILRGYAGTGKTTLMGGLIKWLEGNEIGYALMASTGRAAKILSDKTISEAKTIHSYIYTFKDLDDNLEEISSTLDNLIVDDKGQISLMFDLKIIATESDNLYIIDEASMVSDIPDSSSSFAKFGSGRLLKDLFEYDKNGRYIFVGDPCQLPPIGQDFSPALSKDYIEDQYNLNVTQIELTDVIRQSSVNGIIKASLQIRNLQSVSILGKWATFPLKNHSNIKLHNSHVSLINNYIEKIKINGFEHSTLICQTNKHCSELNRIIRAALGKEDNQLEPMDILMITQNNYLTNLVNGDIVQVIKVGQKEYRSGLSFLQVEVQELSSKEISNVLLIEDILYSTSTNLNNKQHKDLMIDYYRRMKLKGIIQSEKAFKDAMLKDPYLNALKAVYGYALTCHKGQGGEWNEVYLYLDNKIHGIPRPGIFQWIYTAITRAKETLHVVNDWYIS